MIFINNTLNCHLLGWFPATVLNPFKISFITCMQCKNPYDRGATVLCKPDQVDAVGVYGVVYCGTKH